MASTNSTRQEQRLLDAARGGDEGAFRLLIDPHRSELHAHCYRMLGSLHDADDALQDVMLRSWRGLPRFGARSSLRSWLYTIATNACLNAIERRPKRVLPIDYGPASSAGAEPGAPLAETVWVEPYPDEIIGVEDGYASPEARYERRESVEIAFIAALQHLPARQRAVLILREVLGFSAREVAESLETTVPSVNSALQRARRSLEDRLPDQSQQATLRSLGDEGVRNLVERFVDAFEGGEIDTILALLTEDAAFAMPPYPDWYRGPDAVGDSWLMPGGPPPRLRYLPASANGQLALGTYALDHGRDRYLPVALDVLTVRGGEVAEVFAFRATELFPRFGLPDELRASALEHADA